MDEVLQHPVGCIDTACNRYYHVQSHIAPCGLPSGVLPVLVKALVLAPSLAFLACTLLVALVHGDASRRAVLSRLQGPLHLSQCLETSGVHSLPPCTGDNIKLTLSAALTDSNATCKSCVMQTALTILYLLSRWQHY